MWVLSFFFLFEVNCRIIREFLFYIIFLLYLVDSFRLGFLCEILIYYIFLDLFEIIYIFFNVWIFVLVEYIEMFFSVNDSVLLDIIIVCIRLMY